MAAVSATAAIEHQTIQDQITFRQTNIDKLPYHLQEAEQAILSAVQKAITKEPAAWEAYYQATQIDSTVTAPPVLKISAAAGCTIIVKVNDVWLALLGKLNKPGKQEHETFSTLSGKVEPSDLINIEIPVCVAAAAREVAQESHQMLTKEYVTDFLLDQESFVCMLKNPGWASYPTAVFANIAPVPPTPNSHIKLLEKLNEAAETTLKMNPNCEITGYAWVSVNQLLENHQKITQEYNQKKEALKKLNSEMTESDFDAMCKQNPELIAIYNTQIEMLAQTSVGTSTFIKVNDGARRTFGTSAEIIEERFKMAEEVLFALS